MDKDNFNFTFTSLCLVAFMKIILAYISLENYHVRRDSQTQIEWRKF